MKKTWIAILALALCLTGFSGLALADNGKTGLGAYGLSGSMGVDLRSAYFDSVNNSRLSNSGVLQPYVSLEHSSGLYLGWIGTWGINQNGADDLTWTVGYKKANLYQGIGIDLSVSYLDLPPTWLYRGDFWGPRAEVNRPFAIAQGHTLTPYVSYTYLLSANGGQDAGVTTLGARYNWKAGTKCSLDLAGSLSFDEGVYGLSSATFGRVEGSFTYDLGKGFALKVIQAGVVLPMSDQPASEARNDVDGYIGTGVVFSF